MRQLLRANSDVVAIVLFILLFAGNSTPNNFRTSLIGNAAGSVHRFQLTALNLGHLVENQVRAIEAHLRLGGSIPCRVFESFPTIEE